MTCLVLGKASEWFALKFGTIIIISYVLSKHQYETEFNPFAPGDFAEKHVLKLVKWFSGHSHAIKS